MNEQLLALMKFCHGDGEFDTGRFFSVEYNGRGTWEVAVYLGEGYTCTAPMRVGRDRWLKVTGGTYPEVLAKAVVRLDSVRLMGERARAVS